MKQSYDADDSHVGLDVNSIVSVASRSLSELNITISSENVTKYTAWVEYSGEAGQIDMYVDFQGRPKPRAPVLSIRPCNLAFGADQFDPKTEAGKRGINSFFNWYYFTFTIAMMISSTVIVYVQSNVSWAVGLAIPAGLMFLSCAFFFVGTPIYVRVRPEGSPFTGVIRVAVAAFRKRRLRLPEECPTWRNAPTSASQPPPARHSTSSTASSHGT